MNPVIGWFLGIFIVMNCYADSTSSALPENVVKVTKENNAKCVVYLTYKGELYCSFVALHDDAVDPQILTYEQQNIHFDDRVWKPAWGQKSNAGWTVEYIPAGDNINQWKELVTSQFIPGTEGVTPAQFKKTFITNLKKTGVTYSINTINEQPNQLIFEFKVTVPVNLQQDEIQKITRGKNGIYVLHYTIKKAEMSKANRQKWIENLKNSSIKE
ncbi:hypothetical protein [Legionella bononiensis]|uniref:DUF4390 domain-containing protein n=1 Tax=Legionella bononiensis TaxID=2793102 RepID=A0ABS1WAD5_9GAMM|nr:hypothetical protein [Legionella bononiensis]MBL7480446.1 hypothetical protein [Legionella bononiensis]MBL7526319.1 hypothetical protein [Legionella bononiensis]MBL7563186.1 hypothetical protein [Legionella bononiensis]